MTARQRTRLLESIMAAIKSANADGDVVTFYALLNIHSELLLRSVL